MLGPLLRRGDPEAALPGCAHVFEGEFEFAGQEHFYLETHAALASVDENGQIFVQSSTQHPTETQEIVAHVLGKPNHEVTVQCLRMGGGFGGKEMQPHGFAAIAALGAVLTGRPVRVRLNRTQDITMSGKRHGFHAMWRVGFDDDGTLQALDRDADRGRRLEPRPVRAGAGPRAVPHRQRLLDPEHRGARADRQDQQDLADRVPRLRRAAGHARDRGHPRPVRARARPERPRAAPAQLLHRRADHARTARPVRHPERIERAWDQVLETGDVDRRLVEIEAFNATHQHTKRALAITPVKFGISFNLTAFNQAGALVHVYKDGSVLINHGGTEMGQGLHTKMLQVAATALGVPLSIGAAGADPHRQGAQHLGHRGQLGRRPQRRRGEERLRADQGPAGRGGRRRARRAPGRRPVRRRQGDRARDRPRADLRRAGEPRLLPAGAAVGGRLLPHRGAALGRQARCTGSPFKYFAYGVAASEVEVDGFTGAYRLRRVDIVHDVGDSLSPLVDLGQVEGGFVQGAGWLTLEDLRWDTGDGPSRGRLATQAASTYKLPSFSEMPEEFNVALLEKAHEDGAVYGSKAVGEPPLMLAFSVREALREAVAAFGPTGHCVDLGCPATPEAVFWADPARSLHGCPDARPRRHPPSRSPEAAPSNALDERDGAAARAAGARGAGDRGGRARARAAGGRGEDGRVRATTAGAASAAATSSSRRCSRRASCWPRAPASRRPETWGLTDRAPAQHGVQCCGGEVTVLFEPLPVVPAVAIFGMGHVGCELARILARHDIELHLVDSRRAARRAGAAGRAHRRRRGPGAHPPRAVVPELVLGELPAGMPRAADDPRPRRGRRAVRRRAALRAPGLDRPDRVLGEVAPVRASGSPRRGTTQAALARITTPIGLPGDHRQGAGDHRRQRGRRPAAAVPARASRERPRSSAESAEATR